ncbi:MAG: preprotein translocase subunit YajC [Rhodospirillaceae bacterium TMED63]|nr:preprotein translocase subunit YajC [Rhodospirillaceae bacterium]RPF97659.1 MAG: preprotein translocase subunit YajC [Rhodospirillaceae bacterium TMED63]
MFVSPAWAQGVGGGGLGGMEQLLPLVLIFVVFYFLLIRPQQKKAKVHREMLGNLRRGDRIVTNGGLMGTITRVPNETELIVEVADGVKVRVLRGMIAESLSKSEPAPAKSKKDQTEDEQDHDEAEDDYDEDENVDIEEDKKD